MKLGLLQKLLVVQADCVHNSWCWLKVSLIFVFIDFWSRLLAYSTCGGGTEVNLANVFSYFCQAQFKLAIATAIEQS